MKKVSNLPLFLSIFILLRAAGGLFAAGPPILENVLKPEMIRVLGNDLLVVEKHNFFIFSLPDLKLKKKVGKLGEGPGEFKPDPSRPIAVAAFKEFILGESRNKIIWFSRKGEFIKEIRKSPGIIQTRPVGKNYAVLRILYGPGGKNYFAVSIYGPDMKEIKLLYKQKFFTHQSDLFVMPDALFYAVIGDKIYVDQSPEGFLIGIYDANGNNVGRIKRDYIKVPVTQAHKDAAFNSFLEIPSMQRIIKARGRAAAIAMTKEGRVVYPDYFPPILYMTSDKGYLYIKTPQKKGDKDVHIKMDTKGNLIETFYVPPVQPVEFLVNLQGDKKYYTYHNDTFYYLDTVETDEDEEAWQLHTVPLKPAE